MFRTTSIITVRGRDLAATEEHLRATQRGPLVIKVNGTWREVFEVIDGAYADDFARQYAGSPAPYDHGNTVQRAFENNQEGTVVCARILLDEKSDCSNVEDEIVILREVDLIEVQWPSEGEEALPAPAQKVVNECIAEAWRNTEQNDATTEADVATDIAQRLFFIHRVHAMDDGQGDGPKAAADADAGFTVTFNPDAWDFMYDLLPALATKQLHVDINGQRAELRRLHGDATDPDTKPTLVLAYTDADGRFGDEETIDLFNEAGEPTITNIHVL